MVENNCSGPMIKVEQNYFTSQLLALPDWLWLLQFFSRFSVASLPYHSLWVLLKD
uniref:Uncharacterized protein n=1 Tax=Arion vulgaris TaxID=1028688 RepID=A0A0B7BCA5_9EUPU